VTQSWFGTTILLASLIGCGTSTEAPAVRRSPADSAAAVSRPVVRMGATQPATAVAGVRGYVGQNLSYAKSYSGRMLIDAGKQAEEPVIVGSDLRWSVITKGTPDAFNDLDHRVHRAPEGPEYRCRPVDGLAAHQRL
jgi:hypothetical protein